MKTKLLHVTGSNHQEQMTADKESWNLDIFWVSIHVREKILLRQQNLGEENLVFPGKLLMHKCPV
jgi:hypothetical protein